MLVGGFKRDVASHIRTVAWEQLVKGSSPWHLQVSGKPRFPVLRPFFLVDFTSNHDLVAAIEDLATKSIPWKDPTYGTEVFLYAKRDKEIDKIILGRFRSNFYKEFQQYFKNHVDYMNTPFQIKIANHKLYISINNDDIALLKFTPKIVKDRTGMETFDDNMAMFGITKEISEKLIGTALASAQ